jgi:hypothetical protein
VPAIQWLVDQGVSANAVDNRGFTARDYATDEGMEWLVRHEEEGAAFNNADHGE